MRARSLLGAGTHPSLDFRCQPRDRRAVHSDAAGEMAARFPAQKAGVAYTNAELFEVSSRQEKGLDLCVHGLSLGFAFERVWRRSRDGNRRRKSIGSPIMLDASADPPLADYLAQLDRGQPFEPAGRPST